jgi:DNA (cytosine-5)-methyltransferase 1
VRVIDLYAGVGGWSVGLKLAGFDIVRSYEWWQAAANTHRANCGSTVEVIDIRTLDTSTLPKDIDLVVGSPPCTQFSYSNRGGSGDVEDGLLDIAKFLSVVRACKPKAWAFENVPRVKSVLEKEILPGGALNSFADLFDDAKVEVFDFADFGLPQRRRRCIAGNFDFNLLASYSRKSNHPTLGDVVSRLSIGREPIFKDSSKNTVTDNDPEEPLNWEEQRFNSDMKVAHPVYNGMPFPDPLDRSSRTVTATCTRVSRESLIIKDDKTGGYRRLSVRERASLQSFPVNFQFLGSSHSQKLKMIGNAIPPLFTYMIGEAVKGTPKDKLIPAEELDANSLISTTDSILTKPDNSGRAYPENRRFRFSIPNLRFKSGTRFELANIDGPMSWAVCFYFGDSKRIQKRQFTLSDVDSSARDCSLDLRELLKSTMDELRKYDFWDEIAGLQETWSHRSNGLHPFSLIDAFGDFAERHAQSDAWTSLDEDDVKRYVTSIVYSNDTIQGLATQKIENYATMIAIGSLVAALANQEFSKVFQPVAV